MNIEVPPGAVEAFCRKWKIREFTPFGSVLRDDFRPDSDVDVLVAFEPGANHTLFDLAEMDEEAAEIFGRKVDLVQLEHVRNPFIRHGILHRPGAPVLPRDRDAAYLWEMREAAAKAWRYAGNRTDDEFASDKVLKYALANLLETIGRFAAKVSPACQEAHPEVPWERLVAHGDALARATDVDATSVATALRTDLQGLAETLDRLVPPLPDGTPALAGSASGGMEST